MWGSRNWTLVALGAGLAFASGCDSPTVSNDTSSGTSAWEAGTNLNTAYGGYDFKAEAEAFGDPAVLRLDAEEMPRPVPDPDSLPTPNGFAVRVLWGQLRGNPAAESTTVWDGNFTVSSGGLAVLRTIAFELRTDYLLPRDNRQVVPFRSQTRPHFDGLLLLVHDRDNDPNATLTMTTRAFTRSWTFEELRDADLLIPVDDIGNAVSIAAVSLPGDPTLCPNGTVRGAWYVRDDESGVFRGLWMTHLGRPIGYIRGHFGINDAGDRVWFGKIIDRSGNVIGLARGTFAPSTDPAVPGGTFEGHWAASEGERTGVIAGHYMPARDGRDGAGGFFHARWKADCADTSNSTTE
jgi:hypothetical protein